MKLKDINNKQIFKFKNNTNTISNNLNKFYTTNYNSIIRDNFIYCVDDNQIYFSYKSNLNEEVEIINI